MEMMTMIRYHDDDYREDGMLMMVDVGLLTGRARWDGVQGSLRVQVFQNIKILRVQVS